MDKRELVNYLNLKARFLQKEICELGSETHIDHIHYGGLLSSVEVLTALYYHYLDFRPDNLDLPSRNRFIPSKPHCAMLLYVILVDMGIYEKKYVFDNYKRFGHPFFQVPNIEVKGIEVSTGSLGMGLSISVGIAMANLNKNYPTRVFCLLGDGEMQEGSNWEAIMYAGSHEIGNLVCILDNNKCTASFRYGDNIVVDWENAFRAFGWNVITIDGSCMDEIVDAFETIVSVDVSETHKPTIIISNTRKGQNVDFIQGPGWHYGHLSTYDKKRALDCIDKHYSCIDDLSE